MLKVHETGLIKIVWVPPEYGDGIACVCDDGTLSLWEEVSEGKPAVLFDCITWKSYVCLCYLSFSGWDFSVSYS